MKNIPKSPLKLVHDRILVERVPDDNQRLLVTLADPAKDERFCAVVVAVGPGRQTEFGATLKPCVSVGDKISIIPRRGVPYEMHGHTYMLLENADVAGVVDDDVVKELMLDKQVELPKVPPALFGAQ